MAYFKVERFGYALIEAESEEEATEYANEHPECFIYKSGGYTGEIHNEFEREKELLNVLLSFRGSNCEREWLCIKDACATQEDSKILRMAADFIEKGELSQYNGSLRVLSKTQTAINIDESRYYYEERESHLEAELIIRSKAGESRYYYADEPYDIDKDIENLKERIAEHKANLERDIDKFIHVGKRG